MSAMSEPHITLDRLNLQRLADVMAKVPDGWDTDPAFQNDPNIVAALPGIVTGWNLAVAALKSTADEMPELYGDHGWPAMEVPKA